MKKNTKNIKNKLTAILRRCEKQYFTELLEINKGNMKETWKILNGLINKKSKGKQISTEFNGDESKTTGDKTIAILVRHWQKEFTKARIVLRSSYQIKLKTQCSCSQ